jgi:RND superfamily putative drug exporter
VLKLTWIKMYDHRTDMSHHLDRVKPPTHTAAAIIMRVFLSFVCGSERVFKLFGPRLAGAVFVSPSVIGRLLLPAMLELGRSMWQLPRGLSRGLPRVQLHPSSEPTPAIETSQ